MITFLNWKPDSIAGTNLFSIQFLAGNIGLVKSINTSDSHFEIEPLWLLPTSLMYYPMP